MRDFLVTGPVHLLGISVRSSRNSAKAFQVSRNSAFALLLHRAQKEKRPGGRLLFVRDERLELPTFAV